MQQYMKKWMSDPKEIFTWLHILKG